MLTMKQDLLLRFIHDWMKTHQRCPSFDEMMEGIGLKSKSNIHRLVSALEERGYVRRLPNRARALEIIKPPLDEGGQNLSAAIGNDSLEHMVSLPMIGRIAAGLPAEAISNPDRLVQIPLDLLPDAGSRCFVLEVTGDSMVEAGIHDGDYAVIKQQNDAHNGDIVVALVDGTETTLKRFRRRGNSIALEPANPLFETRIYGPDRVAVQGKLTALIRQYG